MRMWRAASLRWKILLTVLVGAVVPLGLIGLWLTSSAERSGETLLRQQLEVTLQGIEQELAPRWVHRRSDLLLLAENDAVQRALRQPPAEALEDEATLRFLREAYAGLQSSVERVLYRDAAGTLRWTLAADPAQVPQLLPSRVEDGWPAVVPASSDLPVMLEISDMENGALLGTFEARVRMSSLLPAGTERSGPAGAVLSVLDSRSGASLLPAPFDPALLRADHFEWEGGRWLAVRRTLDEPAIQLVMAARLDPYTAPFERTARQGALALLAVALFGFSVAAILTHRMTRSFGRLAEAAEAVSRGELERRVEEVGEDDVGRVAHAFNSMTDSLQRTLDELSQREALAAVGEFASALAHEVRNPLTAVRLDLQHLQEKLPPDPRLRESLTRALDGVRRLDRTVTGSLRVARSGRIVREPLDLRAVLEWAAHSARPEFVARGATLEALPGSMGSVDLRGDGPALEQLFLNLLLNAAQALEPGGTAGVAVDEGADEVVVRVWDTGSGISNDDLERVLQPFFSTKADGTGLGLAIAERVAAAHGGGIRIDSAPGAGTTIHVRLARSGAGYPQPFPTRASPVGASPLGPAPRLTADR
jgi:signal transduction histidine kinase